MLLNLGVGLLLALRVFDVHEELVPLGTVLVLPKPSTLARRKRILWDFEIVLIRAQTDTVDLGNHKFAKLLDQRRVFATICHHILDV